MKFKTKFSKVDIFFIPIVLIASLILSLVVFFGNSDTPSAVCVYVQGKLEYSEKLPVTKKIYLYKTEESAKQHGENKWFDCLQADMTIEIDGRSVRVEKEQSPRHICSQRGWFTTPNLPVLCEPNSVLVIIESREDNDFIVPIGVKFNG